MVRGICFSYRRQVYPCLINYCGNRIAGALYWRRILSMDDTQQKSEIDEAARVAKEEIDKGVVTSRQLLADQEIEKIRKDAEDEITQIQNDAQR